MRPVVVADAGPLIALARCRQLPLLQVHPNQDNALCVSLCRYLDEGEAQALCLAQTLECSVLMDERRGRAAARRLGLPLFGVLGVLLASKRDGRLARVAPVFSCLQTNGYRIAPALTAAVLEAAGESGEENG